MCRLPVSKQCLPMYKNDIVSPPEMCRLVLVLIAGDRPKILQVYHVVVDGWLSLYCTWYLVIIVACSLHLTQQSLARPYVVSI